MSLNLPNAPIISGIGTTTFVVSIASDGNPVGTFYSLRIIYNGIINYVTSSGTFSAAQIYNNLLTITAVNIPPATQFTIQASAAQDAQGSNATAYGPVTTFVTLPAEFSPTSPFTPQQQQIIEQSRILMPEKFSVNCTDEKILAFAEVVVSDINLMPPLQGFTTETFLPVALPLLYFGISLFADLFFQMGAALLDFNYNDNGLSLNIDQTGKIGQSYVNMLNFYDQMKKNFKKTQIFAQGAFGISSPRYQSQIGQFLKISLGCFLDSVRVLTANGYRNISTIKVGTKVLCADGKFHKVYDTIKRKVSEPCYEVQVGKRVLKMTGNHQILLKDWGWVAAEELKVGDTCFVGINLIPQKITKIKTFNFTGTVYDLSVEGEHSYNAEGIIVHNSSFNWNSPS